MTRPLLHKALGLSFGLHGILITTALLYKMNSSALNSVVPLMSITSIIWQSPQTVTQMPLGPVKSTSSKQTAFLQQQAVPPCRGSSTKQHAIIKKIKMAQNLHAAPAPSSTYTSMPETFPSIEDISLKNAYMPTPPYPPKARRLGYEGSLHLKASLGGDGHIHLLEVLNAKAPLILVDAALKTVKKWRFDQATAQQYPVLIIPVRFKLSA